MCLPFARHHGWQNKTAEAEGSFSRMESFQKLIIYQCLPAAFQALGLRTTPVRLVIVQHLARLLEYDMEYHIKTSTYGFGFEDLAPAVAVVVVVLCGGCGFIYIFCCI